MTAREWLTHLEQWLRVFPFWSLDAHTWVRRVDPDMEPDYTCLVCGHVIGETELDRLDGYE